MRWLILHANGTKQQLALDKRQLIQYFNLDIPTRDMRLMDSTLMGANIGSGKESVPVHHQGAASSAGQLLVRDNALVLCMEHVRMIITADKVRERCHEKEPLHANFRRVSARRKQQGPCSLCHPGERGNGTIILPLYMILEHVSQLLATAFAAARYSSH